MYVLALDTSSMTGSVALFQGRKILSKRQWTREGSHSESLTASFAEILLENKLRPQNIERVATGLGPGSFTGIRVGINFARALGYSLNIPIYGLHSLQLLASQKSLPTQLPIRVMQYAFRDLVYISEYQLDQGLVTETLAPIALTAAQVSERTTHPYVVIGTGYDLLKDQFSSQAKQYMTRDIRFRDIPLAEDFAQTSAFDESPIHLTHWIHTIPLYIRASEAEEKLRRGLLKPL